MSEHNYAHGKNCTWHGPLISTLSMRTIEEGIAVMMPHCPVCLGELRVFNEEMYLAELRVSERRTPGTEALFNWSKGKCFPDMDTLENAYRQAMEE